jgi:hypothetical protein
MHGSPMRINLAISDFTPYQLKIEPYFDPVYRESPVHAGSERSWQRSGRVLRNLSPRSRDRRASLGHSRSLRFRLVPADQDVLCYASEQPARIQSKILADPLQVGSADVTHRTTPSSSLWQPCYAASCCRPYAPLEGCTAPPARS